MRPWLRRFLAGLGLVAVLASIAAGYAYHLYRNSSPPVYDAADAPRAGRLPGNGAPRLALVLSSGGGRGYARCPRSAAAVAHAVGGIAAIAAPLFAR